MRRGYLFLKIFSFYFTIEETKNIKKESLLGVYLLTEIKGLVKIYCRQIDFKFGFKNTIRDRCPVCDFLFPTFKELKEGVHLECKRTWSIIKEVNEGR